jgi:hypothetical protein
MEQDEFDQLLERYRNGEATPEEVDFIDAYYKAFELRPDTASQPDEFWQEIKAEVDSRIDQQHPSKVTRLWPRIAAAASVLLFLSIGAYWLLHKNPTVQLAANDVAPFSRQAILKTGHGKTLILDSNAKGTLAQYANTHIQKTGNEQIAYTNSSATAEKVIFDTLQVPAGARPYYLQLADGSKVIVNVASALRFPENFRKNNNEVELISGEAYFSIIHNTRSPLLIKARNQAIEDIGTEFNVNTYTDEPDSRTTLVEGAVKVNKRFLLPGQQAIMIGSDLTIAKADVEQTTSWKNGYFRFNGENIQTVMRELARWYNIEVNYEGQPSKEGYYVKISRSRNISEVLKVLERTNSVHFKIEGRRITVLSKK